MGIILLVGNYSDTRGVIEGATGEKTKKMLLPTNNLIGLLFVSVLLIALSKPAINEVFLVLVSYAIIFTFFLIEVCLALTSFPR